MTSERANSQNETVTDESPAKSSTPPASAGLADQTKYLSPKRLIGVFLGLEIAITCAMLDSTIVATALPQITSELKGGREASWVANAYLITNMAFIPLYSRWSDIFGRKPMLLLSLSIFWVFSLGCSLAHTMLQLIVLRAFQGVGGAAIFTLSYIIISDVVSLRERGKYQAINDLSSLLSATLGPLLGGVFTKYTTWRWCFWINLPLTGIAILTSVLFLPLRKVPGSIKEKIGRVDYTGSLLTVVAAILIQMALTWGGVSYPWVSAAVLVPFLLGVTLVVVFLFWEGKVASLPLIPPSIFKNRTVSAVFFCTLTNGMAHYAIMFYIPQFLQVTRAYSPLKASYFLLPFMIGTTVFLFINGQIVSRTGVYRPSVIFGYACWLAAQIMQATITENTSNSYIIGAMVLAGTGAGGVYQTSLVAVQASVSRKDMAVVTGTRNFMRLFGSIIALAIANSLVNNKLRTASENENFSSGIVERILDDPTLIASSASDIQLDQGQKSRVISLYTRGIQGAFYMTVAATGISLLLSIFLIQSHSLDREDDKENKEKAKAQVREKEGKPNDNSV